MRFIKSVIPATFVALLITAVLFAGVNAEHTDTCRRDIQGMDAQLFQMKQNAQGVSPTCDVERMEKQRRQNSMAR